jgi:hypothetical protein
VDIDPLPEAGSSGSGPAPEADGERKEPIVLPNAKAATLVAGA